MNHSFPSTGTGNIGMLYLERTFIRQKQEPLSSALVASGRNYYSGRLCIATDSRCGAHGD